MAFTHLSLYYHVVFSTKNRKPFIFGALRDQLYAFLVNSIQTLNGVSIAVGGTNDHVHILMRLRSNHCLAEVVRELKRSSSMWIHEKHRLPQFSWQEGYGAFTVSSSQVEAAKLYIRNQENHHRKWTFQDEYLAFLKRSGVEYDERYLWT